MSDFVFDAPAALERVKQELAASNRPNRPNRTVSKGPGLGGLGRLGRSGTSTGTPDRDGPDTLQFDPEETARQIFPRSTSPGGRPPTSTGRVVLLDEWRRLSDCDRNGLHGWRS